MFMTALNVSRGWQRNLDKIQETRKYDVEVRLHAAAPVELVDSLRSLREVRIVEAWGYAPAAFSRPGQLAVVRTYPIAGTAAFRFSRRPPTLASSTFPYVQAAGSSLAIATRWCSITLRLHKPRQRGVSLVAACGYRSMVSRAAGG